MEFMAEPPQPGPNPTMINININLFVRQGETMNSQEMITASTAAI